MMTCRFRILVYPQQFVLMVIAPAIHGEG